MSGVDPSSFVPAARPTARIHILLPVHNRRAITERFVECLRQQTFDDFHLILIDDGSTDGTADMATAALPRTTVLRGRGDWWWGGSLQQGYEWLQRAAIDDDTLILFINDDLTIPPNYLERALVVMADRKRSFVLSRFHKGDRAEPEETGTLADLRRLEFTVAGRPEQINCLATQGLFAHWSAVRAVGGFHPRLLPHYLSDYEYTIRAHRLGFVCETSAELVIDLNHDTTGYHRIEEKNFLTFLKKYFSVKSPHNPVYFTAFVLLACPRRWVVRNCIRVWTTAFKTIYRALKDSIKYALADRTVRL